MSTIELPEPVIFEWDEGNKIKSLIKHGITNLEAEETFFHFKLIIPDQRHSSSEQRFGMYGQTKKGKIVFIVFTIRARRIRIISSRLADKKERNIYEQQIEKTTGI